MVLALLWAQSLGLWHGIVHSGHGEGGVHAQQVAAESAPPFISFESLLGKHYDSVDCQLFDQLCHGDALATALVLVLPPGVGVAHIARLTGLAVARWAAPFQARAPPSSR